MKRFFTAAASFLVCFLCLTGPSRATGQELTVIMKSPPMHLNNAVTSSTQTIQIATQLFASPLRYDLDWNPEPYLASSWSFSEDKKSLTLHLVPDAVFHDGKPVTSEDVAFSIMTIKANHPFKTMFEPVEAVDTPDPHTAVIRLSKPHPAILLCLAPPLCPIIPKHVYGDGQDVRTHPANSAPVGSGPFRFVEMKAGEYVILEKNPQFFIKGRPALDRVIFRFVKDPSGCMMAMSKGEAQLFPLVENTRNIARLEREAHLAVTSKGYEGIGAHNWLEFNLRKPELADVRVRKAVNYAIDRAFIINKLHGGLSTPSTGPLIPASPFYEKAVETYPLDLGKARALLDEAGCKPGKDGVRFALTLDFEPGLPEQQKMVAEYLKSQLRKVGIDVRLHASPDWSSWAERVSNGTHDMTLAITFSWGDPVIGTHRSYMSGNIRKGVAYSNMSGYRNGRVDALLEQAGQEMDPAKRAALYKEFQKIVADEAPIAYLNVIPYYTVYDKRLQNVVTSIWGPLSPMDTVSFK